MLVIVDVEKFKNDPEFYNEKYCDYILKNWNRYLSFCSKRRCECKTEKSKDKYLKWINTATDNIFKINQVKDNL